MNLTDDLADFMVNPPTDPECSDEETLRNSQDEPILSGMTRDNTMTNLEELPAVTNGQAEEEEEIMMHQSLDHMDSGIEKVRHFFLLYRWTKSQEEALLPSTVLDTH